MEPDSQPLFNEREISVILKRAAEIQGADGPARAFGLSLAELQQLAAEAGIDPHSVAVAAAEMGQHHADEHRNLWGGPLTLTLDRVVEGEVDEAAWEEMVAAIRRTFNNTGTVQSWGKALEWTHGTGPASTQAHVTVTPRDGRTRIQVFWNDQLLAAPFYVITGVLSLIMIPIVFGALMMVSLAGAMLYLGLVASLFMLARWLLSRVAGKEKRQIRSLMARLEQIAAEHAPRREIAAEAALSEPAPLAPLLSLDRDEPAPNESIGRRDQTGSTPRIHSEP